MDYNESIVYINQSQPSNEIYWQNIIDTRFNQTKRTIQPLNIIQSLNKLFVQIESIMLKTIILKFYVLMFTIQFLFYSVLCSTHSNITMPQIPIELGEKHILFIDDYFCNPNMNYSIITNRTECMTPYINIKTPEIVTLREHIKIKNGFDQISSERSSQMIYFEAPNYLKQFYIGFFSNDLMFYLYNLTDFNEYMTKNNTIKRVGTANLQSKKCGPGFQFKGCYGLNYKDPYVFYSLCVDVEDYIYFINVNVSSALHGLQRTSKDSNLFNHFKYDEEQSFEKYNEERILKEFNFPVECVYNEYTLYQPGSPYSTFMGGGYIFYPVYQPGTEIVNQFCYDNVVYIRPLLRCYEEIIAQMKEAAGINKDTDYNFIVTDVKIVGFFVLISEANNGIFVLKIGEFASYIVEVFLYPITSIPNQIYTECYNDFEYKILVSTVQNNEVIVFQDIKLLFIHNASEVLKLDRIYGFFIPKFYSFGLINSLNDHFIINELYNSMKKTASIRISSRQSYQLNDATIKILDLDIQISSVVYIGFIETFTNSFVVISSNDIYLYSVDRPHLLFDASFAAENNSELSLQNIFDNYNVLENSCSQWFSGPPPFSCVNLTYCVNLGDKIGKGSLIVFQQDSKIKVSNNKFKNSFYYNYYDPSAQLLLDDSFIGSDLNLTMSQVYHSDTDVILNLTLITPLLKVEDDELSKFQNEMTCNVDESVISMDLASYASSTNMYRMHLILSYQNYICNTYTEVNYFTNEVIDIVQRSSSEIRNVNFQFTYMYQGNNTERNSYMYALSIVNKRPEFHIFIVSDIVSWVNKTDLWSITNQNYTMQDRSCIVACIQEDNVIIIRGKTEDKYKREQTAYYLYSFNGSNITLFDSVNAKDTQFSVSKFIYISEFLYYIIYSDAKFVDVYKLSTIANKHYIEYRLGIDGNTTYLSGHACGNYLVLETNHEDFHLFDVDDALNPQLLMLLPGTSGYASLITTDNGFYHCVSEDKIIIPMRLRSCIEDGVGYLFYYDLTKSKHNALIQKLQIGYFRELKALKIIYYGEIGYIYILTNKELIAVRSYEYYTAMISESQYDQFSQFPNITYEISSFGSQFGLKRLITFNGVKSGFMLQPICDTK